jgi:hypothetical protein
MTVPARVAAGDVIESVIAKGDLARLTPDERTRYYVQLCTSLGLNPHTQPFAYITLNGKLQLYAKRDAADQLRKIHGVSLQIVSQEIVDELLTIHVKAIDKDGRSDEDLGVVPLPPTLKGDARANQVMKAITKAKRRVTLSISGLGFLDETEVQDIPVGGRRPPPPAPNAMDATPPHDPETGEVIEEGSSPPHPDAARVEATVEAAPSGQSHSTTDGAAPADQALLNEAREAAKRGRPVFSTLWRRLTPEQRAALAPIQDELGRLMLAAQDEAAR